MAARERLDVLVWQRGLAPSRAKARALILAGQIAVNGARTTRAGTPVDLQATVTRLGAASPYVSRGGEKLAAALAAFGVYLARRRIIYALKTGAIVYIVLLFGRLFIELVTGGARSEPLGEFVWPALLLGVAWVVLWWVSTAYAERRDREKRLRRASGAGRAGR